MFFFIAGVQPKKVTLDEQPAMCPSCGLYQARLRRMDHYISVFFIPLIRVKKGAPFLECQRCGSISQEPGAAWVEPSQQVAPTCPHCGKALESGFRFCPFCGRPV